VTARRLGLWLLAAGGAVALVIVLDSSGLLSDRAAMVVDDAAQLAAGTGAAVLCAVTSRRVQGPERTWRRFMAVGMVGWSVGQALWSWYQIFADTPLPSPSLADVGYLTMPVLALPALLALGCEMRPPSTVRRRHVMLVYGLDGMIAVGSLFILTWSTALGAVFRAGGPTDPEFAVAIAYPLTDLMLVVIVVLLAVTQRVPRPLQGQLWLLGCGLVAISVSDSIFAYIVSSGGDDMPPSTNAGFILGPLLIGLAALAPAAEPPQRRQLTNPWAVERGHLVLPYVLVGLTGAVVGAQLSLGQRIDTLEAWVAWIVLGLVLVRQIVTLLENTSLLERVSAAQTELAYRAQHDPLTGLANRSLFSERLRGALDRYQIHGWPFGLLLIDLDDFKAVNDNLGHATGDRLLRAVGERLRGCVRNTDTVARIGGDEFAVVLEGSLDTPGIVGERILTAFRNPFEIDGRVLSLGASLGLVEPSTDDPALHPDLLMQQADSAMYLGKRQGKGVAVQYRPETCDGMPHLRELAPLPPPHNGANGSRQSLDLPGVPTQVPGGGRTP
jgi:diguanylate cyclase